MYVHPQTPLLHEKHTRTDNVKETNPHRIDMYTVKHRWTHVKKRDTYK